MARTKQTTRKLSCRKQLTAKNTQHNKAVTKSSQIHDEIRRHCKSINTVIDKLEFQRLVRIVALEIQTDMRFQVDAICKLQVRL